MKWVALIIWLLFLLVSELNTIGPSHRGIWRSMHSPLCIDCYGTHTDSLLASYVTVNAKTTVDRTPYYFMVPPNLSFYSNSGQSYSPIVYCSTLFYFYWIGFLAKYCIQLCFICSPSDSTVSEDAGTVPRTVATWHWQSDALTTRLDLIHIHFYGQHVQHVTSLFLLKSLQHSYCWNCPKTLMSRLYYCSTCYLFYGGCVIQDYKGWCIWLAISPDVKQTRLAAAPSSLSASSTAT
jgi:hypothetical protein